MKLQAILFGILTVIWCIVIFSLSAENADESSQTSGTFVDIVCEVFVPGFEEQTETKQAEIREDVSFYVRKTAHFTAYGILGSLAYLTFCMIKRRRVRIPAAVGFACVYACTDEFHQSFVGGRSCELRDVIVDTCGALTFVLLLILFIYLIGIIKAKRKRQSPA